MKVWNHFKFRPHKAESGIIQSLRIIGCCLRGHYNSLDRFARFEWISNILFLDLSLWYIISNKCSQFNVVLCDYDLFSFRLFYGGVYLQSPCSLRCRICPMQLKLRKMRRGIIDPPQEDTKQNAIQMDGILLWWSLGGSNPWPLHCERSALPAELKPRIWTNSITIDFELQCSRARKSVVRKSVKSWFKGK